MQLKEFITQTLLDIRSGVEDANKKDLENNSTIKYMIEPTSWAKERNTNVIKFDVAVNISEESGTKGTGKINVFYLKAGIDTDSKDLNQTTSRIQFNIAINQTIG